MGLEYGAKHVTPRQRYEFALAINEGDLETAERIYEAVRGGWTDYAEQVAPSGAHLIMAGALMAAPVAGAAIRALFAASLKPWLDAGPDAKVVDHG